MELMQFTLSQLVANSLNHGQNTQPSQSTMNFQGLEETFNKRNTPPNLREVKSIITLRSGKQIQQPNHPSILDKESNRILEEGIIETKEMIEMPKSDPPKEVINDEEDYRCNTQLPCLRALGSKKKENHALEIFEIFKQVMVNIPLLDMIKRMPPMLSFSKIYAQSNRI